MIKAEKIIEKIIEKIMKFLEMFMCKTLVKRLVSLVLAAMEIPEAKITEMTGLCNKSVRTLKKTVKSGNIDALFVVGGGGRKAILKDVEASVVEELNSSNYHSKQQIADMIKEKYGLSLSISSVSNLLKKTGLSV
jgi:transposase